MYKRIIIMLGLTTALALGSGDLHYVIGGAVQQYKPEPYSDADWIYFSNGIKFNIKNGEPELPGSLKIEKSDYYLVHCRGPVYSDYVKKIETAGARVYSYLPNYAFLVKMDQPTKEQVAQIEFVDWIGIYQPAYKISGHPAFKGLKGTLDITILLYPDAQSGSVIEYLETIGATITETADNEWDKLINCVVDLSHLHELAKIEAIRWIEPWLRNELHNSSVQWILQTCATNNRRVWDMGIRGQGELCSTSDSGIRTSHYAFRSTASTWITTWGDYPNDRKIIAYKQASGVADFGDESSNSYHGTHTGGTITGDDTLNATDPRDGLAIKARIYFLDGGRSESGGIYLPGDLNNLYILPYNGNAAGSVKIMSNSWGNTAEGAYNANARQSDQFMWNHPDFLLFFSNGNIPPGNYVGSPATAKNVVSVGSCNSGSSWNQFSTFSCHGPTDDGRLKPTLLSPGSGVASASGGSDAGYAYMSGTSMSSPGAAGAGVLVRQYFTDGWYPTGHAVLADTFSPSAALIKAMLVNSTDPSISGYTVPDSCIGWGRIDLDSVLYFTGDAKALSVVDYTTGLSTGNYVEYTYNVLSSSVPFRATLVWTDYPGDISADKELVNDLNLTVTDPNLNVYNGNVYSGGQSTTGGIADTINVEECVRKNSPATGTWTVRIAAANCPFGPQPFALVVTAELPVIGILEDGSIKIDGSNIAAPYPNPFNEKTCFVFEATKVEHIRISVYNVAGQLVKTVYDDNCTIGSNRIEWHGQDETGFVLPDGMYFYSIQRGENKVSGKLIIQH